MAGRSYLDIKIDTSKSATVCLTTRENGHNDALAFLKHGPVYIATGQHISHPKNCIFRTIWTKLLMLFTFEAFTIGTLYVAQYVGVRPKFKTCSV